MENNTLAKISLGINAVLVILVIIIFTKLPSSADETIVNDEVDSTMFDSLGLKKASERELTGKIAFFNLDSLNSKIQLFKDIETEMQGLNKEMERKMRNKQAELDAWQEKWNKKGQLLSTEQEQYMKEAQQKQMEAQQFEQNVQMKLMQDQNVLTQTYAIRLSNYTQEIAEKEGYDYIYAYQFGQNLWYYNPALDVTNDLAKLINEDHAKSTGATSEDAETETTED